MAAFDSAWSDVTPIPQDDGPDPVAPIAYSADYTRAMDLFRAALASGERSERVLQLTMAVISMNPAHYTAWLVRRQCLDALGKDLRRELAMLEDFDENPKVYQLWWHRRVVAEKIGDAAKELEYTASVFEEDAKNYHCWAHRQWVLRTLGGWEGEMAYIDTLLTSDVRNNSAWNQRWFVITNREGATPASEEVLQEEVDYTFGKIAQAPTNEAAWNYLRGLCKLATAPMIEGLLQRCRATHEECNNRHSASMLATLLESKATQGHTAAEDLVAAAALFTRLQEELDPVRAKYWSTRRERAEAAASADGM